MITPLYDLGHTTTTVTVAAPGAAVNDVSVPVDALTDALPAGTILDFGASKFAKVSADAAVGDQALATEPIPTALIGGDVATVPLAVANPLLSEQWAKLGGPSATTGTRAALQTAYQITAELDLGLRAPVYTADDAEELKYAIVLQLNFMLEHGLTPSVVKSVAQPAPGATRNFRDRWIDPNAAAIVQRVTGVEQVRFTPFLAGV